MAGLIVAGVGGLFISVGLVISAVADFMEFAERQTKNTRHTKGKQNVINNCPQPSNEGKEITVQLGNKKYVVELNPVAQSTLHFYNNTANPKTVYPMHLPTRGLALIINIYQIKGQQAREGTQVDGIKLEHLFQNLHFNVTMLNDEDGLTSYDIYAKVKAFFQDPYHKRANCAIMVLMSHGGADHILDTNGDHVYLNKLYKMMDCTALVDKPKLVFLQACAGGDFDQGIDKPLDDEVDQGYVEPTEVFSSFEPTSIDQSMVQFVGRKTSEDVGQVKTPCGIDFYIGRPSQPGNVAIRNTKLGSWFIQAIVKVFAEYAASLCLAELIMQVNDDVANRESSGSKQAPDQRLNMRKKLFFFPGIQPEDP